jgi:hypothetical protein
LYAVLLTRISREPLAAAAKGHTARWSAARVEP